MDPIGVHIEGFENLTLLGSGGFSRVYRAFQPRFGRDVAVKVLTFDVPDESAIRSFERESRAMGRVSGHPNIVTVHDNGVTRDGRLYIVMEYYEGGNYQDRIANGPIPVGEVLSVGVKVSAALATAHQADILHRDLKPANILISKYGEPALGDFGISTLDQEKTSTGTSGLTVHFASPEVIDGKPTSTQSDLYSLGATLWAMLTGTKPFHSETDQSMVTTAVRILSQPPGRIERADCPQELEELLLEMMAKNRHQRPRDAITIANRLQHIQQNLGQTSTPITYQHEHKATVRRSKRTCPRQAWCVRSTHPFMVQTGKAGPRQQRPTGMAPTGRPTKKPVRPRHTRPRALTPHRHRPTSNPGPRDVTGFRCSWRLPLRCSYSEHLLSCGTQPRW